MDLFIDFPFHYITSIIDVYQDTVTYDKIIFPSTITQILRHFSISIPNSPYFTIMGSISDGFYLVKQNLALTKVAMSGDDRSSSIVPSSLATSTSIAGGVTLEAIMSLLQRMDACLDSLTDEMVLGEDLCRTHCQSTGSPWRFHSLSISFFRGFG